MTKPPDRSPDTGRDRSLDWGTSKVEMERRAEREADLAEERLKRAIEQAKEHLTPLERIALDRVQDRWEAYRIALRELAIAQFADGTNSGIAGATAWIHETSRRAEQIMDDLAARE